MVYMDGTEYYYVVILLLLLKAKCLPALYYGLEACPVNKSQIRSLEYVLNNTFRKIFSILLHIHISKASNLLLSVCINVHVSAAYSATLQTKHYIYCRRQ